MFARPALRPQKSKSQFAPVAAPPFQLPASGRYPWVQARYSFAGWVPNVSGHLSFKLVDSHSGRPTYNHQADLGSRRVVTLHRVRVAQDYPLPDSIVKIIRPEARQDFILFAESIAVKTPYFSSGALQTSDDRHGALIGAVAVLPTDSDKATDKKRQRLIKEVEGVIGQAITDRVSGCGSNPDNLARDLHFHVKSKQSDIACYMVNFALFRTGEVRIWFDLDSFLGRNIESTPPADLEIEAAEHIPAQVYYFLKDLLHAHYHHDKHSDQLLPLTRLRYLVSEESIVDDEIHWRYVVLRSLARVIVEIRQGRSLVGNNRALGIIAYANAFQSVLARILRNPNADIPFVGSNAIMLYDFKNLEMSISANSSVKELANSSRLQLFGIEVGILLSALALWAGAVQVQPILCGALSTRLTCPKVEPGPIVSTVNMIVANPIGFVIFLLVVGFFVFIWMFRGIGAIPLADLFSNWLSRLSEAIGVQISRLTLNSDILGYTISVSLLAGAVGGLGFAAYRLAPKTRVPPIRQGEATRFAGHWASLFDLVGKPVGESGLLDRSVVAPALRNLLGGNYPKFAQLVGAQAILVRQGDILMVAPSAGGDGAYLLIDPERLRLEAGLRHDEALNVYRTPGAAISRPLALQGFLGAARLSDAEPVPVETSGCVSSQTGTAGKTLQLSGALRAHDYCDYKVDLQAGQSIVFDKRRAPGLDVLLMEGQVARPIGSVFTAQTAGPQAVRVAWAGWNPPPSEALKPRPFYVRLDIH